MSINPNSGFGLPHCREITRAAAALAKLSNLVGVIKYALLEGRKLAASTTAT